MKKYLLILCLLSTTLLAGCGSVKRIYTYEYICDGSVSQGFTSEFNDDAAMNFIINAGKKYDKECLLKYIKSDGKDIFRSEVVK